MLLYRPPALGALVLGAFMLSACNSGPTPPTPPTAPTPPTPPTAPAPPTPPTAPAADERASPPRCSALPDWRYERIELPPEFAPTLPAGEEVLWFAPGMFDPKADDYFTYAFSLELESAPDPAAIESLLVDYYRGLMSAVAGSRDASPVHPAVVTIGKDGRRASIELSDEFTDQQVITLDLRIIWPEQPSDHCLQFLATARPTETNAAQLDESSACLCDRASK